MKKLTILVCALIFSIAAFSQTPEFQYSIETNQVHTEQATYVVHRAVLDLFDVAPNQCIVSDSLLRRILFTELDYRSRMDGFVSYPELSVLLTDEKIRP